MKIDRRKHEPEPYDWHTDTEQLHPYYDRHEIKGRPRTTWFEMLCTVAIAIAAAVLFLYVLFRVLVELAIRQAG